jgi:hypothetical protein
MPRQVSAVEVNKFNAGLNTDSSPLTSPDNSSLEEKNMVLNIDGSRNRRLGLDYEDGYEIITTSITDADSVKIAISTFRWDNAGGDPEKSLEVVQFGNEIKFFDLSGASISSSLIWTDSFPSSPKTIKFSYAVVDGILVVATGEKTIYSFTFTLPSTITSTPSRLLIRDLFGVEDVVDGIDITRGSEVQNRPLAYTSTHVYNLRNQSWGIPRIAANSEIVSDPIVFFTNGALKFPSNSDTVIEALYPDAEDTDNRTIDRFFADNLYKNPLGTSRAALGYFIIDALDRGTSRLQKEVENRARFPELSTVVTDLPADTTPSGATCVTEFAGRVFYAGFTGEVIDGDKNSPKMSSYVLFSKVVDNTADINLCYQEGDPTSKNNPEIIDTDGGFIRINEAYGIKRLINLGSSLMVVASNGVWRIVGGTDNGFTATSYIVDKVTDRGCTSQDSVAVIDNSFMFWGDDAIYHVTQDQFGGWVCNNISFGRIQNHYDSINIEDKRWSKGEYDSYERKVRWLYYSRTVDDTPTEELVLDLQLQAYYVNEIGKLDGATFPRAVNIYVAVPYLITTDQVSVIADTDDVLVGVEPVFLSTTVKSGVSQRELGYLVVTSVSPTIQYTFATYRNQEFRDWFSVNSVGVDADAYVVTSYLSGTDFQRDKRVPYITIHLRRTETGYEESGGILVPLNPSSCLVQARWDWSDSDRGGKWGREFQAYRYRRMYLPVDAADDYDNGFITVVSRNKLRGNGKVLSLKFRTEPYKDLHLYGWSMIFSVAENI